MFYKNDDYTIRIKLADGCKKYFIEFHGQFRSVEIEIDSDVFALYLKEFNKPMETDKNEKRRHIASGDLDGFILSGKLTSESLESKSVKVADIELALGTCTPTQRRRFTLYFFHKYTLEEIAGMEKCGKQRVKKSVDAAYEKIKKYFS